jgi:hypothetical protein
VPVIKRPKDRGPLFGSGAQIMIGGPLTHQLREWNKRKETPSSSSDADQDQDADPSPPA